MSDNNKNQDTLDTEIALGLVETNGFKHQGVTYSFLPIGVPDAFKLKKIILSLKTPISTFFSGNDDKEKLTAEFFFETLESEATTESFMELASLVGELIGLSKEDVQDRNKFSIGTMYKGLIELQNHPDIIAIFGDNSMGKMMKNGRQKGKADKVQN